MANVGDIFVLNPDPGWKRYENSEYKIGYYGNTMVSNNYSNYSKGTVTTIRAGGCLNIRFKGSKFRLYIQNYRYTDNDLYLDMDGVLYDIKFDFVFVNPSITSYAFSNILVFELLDMKNTIHNCKVYHKDPTKEFSFDCFDSDEDSELYFAPNSTYLTSLKYTEYAYNDDLHVYTSNPLPNYNATNPQICTDKDQYVELSAYCSVLLFNLTSNINLGLIDIYIDDKYIETVKCDNNYKNILVFESKTPEFHTFKIVNTTSQILYGAKVYTDGYLGAVSNKDFIDIQFPYAVSDNTYVTAKSTDTSGSVGDLFRVQYGNPLIKAFETPRTGNYVGSYFQVNFAKKVFTNGMELSFAAAPSINMYISKFKIYGCDDYTNWVELETVDYYNELAKKDNGSSWLIVFAKFANIYNYSCYKFEVMDLYCPKSSNGTVKSGTVAKLRLCISKDVSTFLIANEDKYYGIDKETDTLIELEDSSALYDAPWKSTNGFSTFEDVLFKYKELEDKSNYKIISKNGNKIRVNGKSSDRGIFAFKNNASIDNIESINHPEFNLNEGDYECKYAISIDDGNTWIAYYNGAWNNLNINIPSVMYEDMSEEEKLSLTDAQNKILEKGNDATDITSADFSSINTKFIRVAVVIKDNGVDNGIELSNFDLNGNTKTTLQRIYDFETYMVDNFITLKSKIDAKKIVVNVKKNI